MPQLLAAVGTIVVIGFLGMGQTNRDKFWKGGLKALWKKS